MDTLASAARRSRAARAFRQSSAGLRCGFTLVEVLVTLAVVGIGLVALLQLQIGSVALSHRAELLTLGALVAEEQLAEALVADLPDAGSEQGTVERQEMETVFAWRRSVEEVEDPGLRVADADIGQLRRVTVEVTWQEGQAQRHVSLTTLVAGWE